MGSSRQSSLLIAEFISSHYSRRVVEVGCGKRSYVAFTIAQSLEVLATDVLEPGAVDECMRALYVKDDITSPNLQLYQNAQLLFSIRPPLEIQHGILNTALLVHADILIKPLGDEIIEALWGHLRNYRGIAFYYRQLNTML